MFPSRECLIEIITDAPKTFSYMIKKTYPEFYVYLQQNNNTFPENLRQFLYPDENIICPICNTNKRKFISIHKGYTLTCSSTCRGAHTSANFGERGFRSLDVQNKIKETLKDFDFTERNNKSRATSMERYGVSHHSQQSHYSDSRKKIMMERYGVEHQMHLDSVREKIKKTNLERYGYCNPFEDKEKIQKAIYSKYGCSPTLLPEFKQRSINTSMSRYGYSHYSQTPEYKERVRKTCLEKYSYSNVSQVPAFKEKTKQTNIKRYGIPYSAAYTPFINQRSKTKTDKTFDELSLRTEYIPLFSKENFKGIHHTYDWKCPVCSTHFSQVLNSNIHCPTCYKGYRSKVEKELADFITANGPTVDIIVNSRTIIPPYEIDIWLPEKKTGVEFCGLYWHRDKNDRKSRIGHLNKLQAMEKKGYTLVTIFEDEWEYRKDICKSRLLSILGLQKRIYHARQTSIELVSSSSAREFLSTYHLSGYVNAKYNIGAVINGELVAIMSFGSLRRALGNSPKENSYELLRFAVKGHIPGIAGKLFRYFTNNYTPSEIISYADRRWSCGNLYRQLGFTFDKVTFPNYWYMFGHKHREHRYKYRKSELVKLGYPADKSEWTIMQERGYDRIWDCGNFKFIWKVDN
jgi:rubrerythrin